MTWTEVFDTYSDEDKALLTRAAEAHSDEIEIAARDFLSTGRVNGKDITELWPFVLKRREEHAAKAAPEPVAEPAVKAPEPVKAATVKKAPAHKVAPGKTPTRGVKT